MPISFRNKRHRRRIRALKKSGYSAKAARRLARKENTARKGSFGKRLWRGAKKVAPYALGAAAIGVGTGLIGAKSIGGLKGIFGKLKLGKAGKAARLAKRAARRTSVGGKKNFFRKIFTSRRLKKRALAKTVNRIKSRGIVSSQTLPKARDVSRRLKRRSFVKSLASAENTLKKIQTITPTLDRKKSANLQHIIQDEVSKGSLGRPTSYKTERQPVEVATPPSETSKGTFVGDLFKDLKDEVKNEIEKTTKPQNPTGNKAADLLQVSEQVYEKVSPLLGLEQKQQLDAQIQDTKEAIAKEEAKKKAIAGFNFLNANSWIGWIIGAFLVYKLYKKRQ